MLRRLREARDRYPRARPTPTWRRRVPAPPDYAYWEEARRCRAPGLEISGLLLKPLASKITAYVLGHAIDGGVWSGSSPAADAALRAWWGRHRADVIRAYEDSLLLGDGYLILDAAGTPVIAPPADVAPRFDDDQGDAPRLLGWQVQERRAWDDLVIDTYDAEGRTRVRVRGGVQTTVGRFDHPTGVIPVVHIANRRGADAFFGTPEGDALLPALIRYGEVIETAIEGNLRQGRPTPVIERMGSADQVRRFWDQFATTKTVQTEEGHESSVKVVEFNPDYLLTLGGDATFRFVAPGSFMGDVETLLKLLFYLIVQHSEIPEAVWGAAIPSSRASAETQMQPFLRWIDKKRALAESWLLPLGDHVLRHAALRDPRIDPDAPPTILWERADDTPDR